MIFDVNNSIGSELVYLKPGIGISAGTGSPEGVVSCYTGLYLDTATGNLYQKTTVTYGNTGWSVISSGSVTGSGAANRIAFWSGASALSSNSAFTWTDGSLQMAIAGHLSVTQPASSATVGFKVTSGSGASAEPFQFVGVAGGVTGGWSNGGAFFFRAMAAPSLSSAGDAKLYVDNGTNKLMASVNGAAYVDLLAPSIAWSALAGPSANLTMSNNNYTTSFQWGNASGLANTEQNTWSFLFNRTLTLNGGGGAIANWRTLLVAPETIAASAAQIITKAATLEITGAPIAGTNVSITYGRALSLVGGFKVTDSAAQTYNVAPTLFTSVIFAETGGVYPLLVKGSNRGGWFETVGNSSSDYPLLIASLASATSAGSLIAAFNGLGQLGVGTSTIALTPVAQLHVSTSSTTRVAFTANNPTGTSANIANFAVNDVTLAYFNSSGKLYLPDGSLVTPILNFPGTGGIGGRSDLDYLVFFIDTYTNSCAAIAPGGFRVYAALDFLWVNSTTNIGGTADLGLSRLGAKKLRITGGSTDGGNLVLGSSTVGDIGTNGVNVLAWGIGTVPTTSPTDTVQSYVADAVAGNANLYARNEAGKVERLTDLGKYVTTQFDKTSSAALANVTGLSHDVEAGRTYAFRAVLYTTSANTGGVRFAVSGTATATAIRYDAITQDAGLTPTMNRATALGTTVGDVTAVFAATCIITGYITVNAAGTLTIQFAQNASDPTASSVLVGSHFILHPLG